MPTHESEQRRRVSPPAARAAPAALSRPFPQPDSSPQSPSSFTSLDRVPACKIACSIHCPRKGYRTEADRSKSWPRRVSFIGSLIWSFVLALQRKLSSQLGMFLYVKWFHVSPKRRLTLANKI